MSVNPHNPNHRDAAATVSPAPGRDDTTEAGDEMDAAHIGTVMRAAERMRDQHGTEPFWLILADWLDQVAKRASQRPRRIEPEMRFALPAARAYLDPEATP